MSHHSAARAAPGSFDAAKSRPPQLIRASPASVSRRAAQPGPGPRAGRPGSSPAGIGHAGREVAAGSAAAGLCWQERRAGRGGAVPGSPGPLVSGSENLNARVAAGPGRRLGIAAAGGGDSGSQTEAAPARRAQAALRPCSGSTLGTVDEALGRAWPRLLKEPGLLPGVNRRPPPPPPPTQLALQ